MARSAGLQRRVRTCKRCGEHYTHTNRMERRARHPGSMVMTVDGVVTSGWDTLEGAWFNTHTLACARKAVQA